MQKLCAFLVFVKSLLLLSCFVAPCSSAFGIKREFGASPELSRSCKSYCERFILLNATAERREGEPLKMSQKTCKTFHRTASRKESTVDVK